MPSVPMQVILKDAFDKRYGVGAFNIVNDLTMDAVLAAAADTRSPVIVQVSLKTVKQMGARLLALMFEEMARRVPVPAALHLDHCPDRDVIRECVEAGWSSVLFDASQLTFADNLGQPAALVAELKPQQNIIAVLVDDSRSMSIPDNGATRESQAVKALEGGVLDELQKKFQIRLYRVDGQLARISKLDELKTSAPASATRIGDSLTQ